VLGVEFETDLLIKQGTQEIEFTRLTGELWRGRRRAVTVTAGQLMSKPAITVPEKATVTGAARLMTQHNVKRLPVVDADGKLVGIASRKDVLTVFLPRVW
jgi:CBS domain-containing protein